MPKDTGTDGRTHPSSLCRSVSFIIPGSWEQLSQEQLRYVIRLLWLYGDAPDWKDRVKTAAFIRFCGIDVAYRADCGWMCREQKSGKSFLLDPALLPSLLEELDWICRTEEMTDRIESIGGYAATDFELRGLMFGDYLMAENFYQAFLTDNDDRKLVEMARLLYRVPDGGDTECFTGDALTGVFLWFSAAKRLLSQWFPHFLRQAGEGEGETIDRMSLHEMTQAQIRLLTKGDVTKQRYILEETDTWTALAELDALAREAEEIRKKYGNKTV